MRYDYGTDGNLVHYGTPSPLEYNLSLVTAPVHLMNADNDPFAPPKVTMLLLGWR